MPLTEGQQAIKDALQVQGKTPMIGGPEIKSKKKKPSVTPLARRMALAYDKLEAARAEEKDNLSPKTAAALGRLVLEFEQVNNNLIKLQAAVKNDTKVKKKTSTEEQKLLEDESKQLNGIRAGFFDIRAKFGLFAGALSLKALAEGRPGDAAVNAGFAAAAFIPEIVKLTSGIVLGNLMGGGPRGGRRMPRMGGRAGLIGGAALLGGGLLLGGGAANAADTRRVEMIRQQRAVQIAPNDITRFSEVTNKFDAILSGVGGFESKDSEGRRAEVKIPDADKDYGPIASTGTTKVTPQTSVTGLQKQALDIISGPESAGSYDAMNQGTIGGDIVGSNIDSTKIIGKKLTSLTVGDILDRQSYLMNEKNPQVGDYGIFAAGRYQFEPVTFKGLIERMGIGRDEMFSPDLQDRMGVQLMKERGIQPWTAGGSKYTPQELEIVEKARQQSFVPIEMRPETPVAPTQPKAVASVYPTIDPEFDDTTRLLQTLSYGGVA